MSECGKCGGEGRVRSEGYNYGWVGCSTCAGTGDVDAVGYQRQIHELQQRIATLETATHGPQGRTEYSMRMESMVDELQGRVKELEAKVSNCKKNYAFEVERADKAEADKEYWRKAGINRTQETMDLRKQCRALEAERDAAAAELEQAKEAIAHLLEGKPFGALVGAQTMLNQAEHIKSLEAERDRLRAWMLEWSQYERDTSECPDCAGCAEDDGVLCLYKTAVTLTQEPSDGQ